MGGRQRPNEARKSGDLVRLNDTAHKRKESKHTGDGEQHTTGQEVELKPGMFVQDLSLRVLRFCNSLAVRLGITALIQR